jgi:hypothetical protein
MTIKAGRLWMGAALAGLGLAACGAQGVDGSADQGFGEGMIVDLTALQALIVEPAAGEQPILGALAKAERTIDVSCYLLWSVAWTRGRSSG